MGTLTLPTTGNGNMETFTFANEDPHFAETMGRRSIETLTSANGMETQTPTNGDPYFAETMCKGNMETLTSVKLNSDPHFRK